MPLRRVSSSKLPPLPPTPRKSAPTTPGAREALRGLRLMVRSSEEAAPKSGLKGFLDVAFSKKGAAAALTGISLLSGAVTHVAQNPALQKSAQDLFERTAGPASAWVKEQSSNALERVGQSPLAVLLGQRTGKAASLEVKAAEPGTPGALLDAIETGRLSLEVPLRAGKHRIKGVNVRVEPGTVLTVQVDVRDGKLVPRAGDEGTFAKLNKPIDGPLFLTTESAHLADRGGGRGELRVRLGTDWFDLFDVGIGGDQPLQLSQLMESFGSKGTSAASKTLPSTTDSPVAKEGELVAEDLIDTANVRFRVDELSFADGVLPASGLALRSTSGGLSLSGDATAVTVSGDVGFDSLALARDEGGVRFGKGQAHVSITARKDGDGGAVTTTVSGLEARIEEVTLAGEQASGGLQLEGGLVRAGELRVSAHGSADGGREIDVHADLRVEGRIAPSALTLTDLDGGATLEARGGTLEGDVRIRGGDVEVEATLEGADLTLSSLQQQKGGSLVDLERARVKGDGRLSIRPVHGASFSLTNAEVDVAIADLRSSGGRVHADLGRTTVKGSGDFSWSAQGGVDIRGDLRVRGAIDDLRVHHDESGSVLDLAPSSSLEGQLRRLTVGGEGFALEALTNVDLRLEGSKLDAGALFVEGGGRVLGLTELRIEQTKRGGRVRLDGDARIDLAVRDGRVRRGDELDADLGEGTRMVAHLRSLELGDGVHVTLGEGSRLDAVLDGGHVRVGDRELPFVAGTAASFEVDRLHVGESGHPELQGRLSVDVPFDAKLLEGIPGVSLLPASEGKARLTIGGVRMGKDGTFSLDQMGLSLTAQTGRVTGATRAPSPTPGPVDGVVPGVLERGAVEGMSAAEIAGVPASERAAFHPLSVAKRLESGTLELSLPMEGRLKKGAVGVRFEEGTELLLRVRVEDGRVIPGEMEARLSKPADGPLWITVKGVRMTDAGTLMLDLGGFFDIALPGMKKMPTDVEGFIGRIESLTTGGGEKTDSDSLFRMADARFSVDGATLSPGPLALPGGTVVVESGTRVSLAGDLEAGEAEMRLAFSSLSLDQGAVAVRGGSGRATVRTSYETDGDVLRSRAQLSDLRFDVESAAFKGEGGDYLHLESGRVAGSGALAQDFTLDESGRPVGARGEPVVDLTLDVGGTVRGARIAARDGKDARVELGETTLLGELEVRGSRLERVAGTVTGFDAALHDLEVATPAGRVEVTRARVSGDGYIELSPDRVAVLDGSLVADVLVDPSALGTLKLGGADVDLSHTELALRLDLSRLTRVEYRSGKDVPADQRLSLDAELGVGAAATRITGTLPR